MRLASVVMLTATDRSRIAAVLRSKKSPAEIVRRVRIVLSAAKGLENKQIAESLDTSEECVGLWRGRFAAEGFDALLTDAPRSGRPRTLTDEQRTAVIAKTTQEKPPGRTHWSRASMAKASGLSDSAIGRIWKASGLKPHRAKSFKLSNDKLFEEKLQDIVGLYLSPPQNAVVFSADEKSQIQALDRTQPGLPLKKGRAGTMTHDYKRNGTTTLFAALNVLTGAVFGVCKPRHTQKEWLAFLKVLRARVPKGQELHVICDNCGTHKAPTVKAWLERHPEVHIHFTPTSASWLNMVERFFRDLTENAVRRGVFTSVHDLIDAIDVYLIEHNREPKPFIWTKDANDILAKVTWARASLVSEVQRLQEV